TVSNGLRSIQGMTACRSRLGNGSRSPDAPSNSRGVVRISPFTRIAKSTSLPGSLRSSTGRTEGRSQFLPGRQQRVGHSLGGQLRAAIGPVTVDQTIGSTSTVEDLAQVHHL